MYLDQIHSIYIYIPIILLDMTLKGTILIMVSWSVMSVCATTTQITCVRCVHWFDASFVFIVVRWSSLIQFTFDLMMMKIICPLALAPIALCVCVCVAPITHLVISYRIALVALSFHFWCCVCLCEFVREHCISHKTKYTQCSYS